MASYWLAFAWGLAILASFVGWGGALNRVLFPAQRVDWGQRAAWGVALSVVIGGVLNLLQRISRTTVLVYLGLGIAWCLASWISRIRDLSQIKGLFQTQPDAKYERIFVCGVLLVVALTMIQYAASISGVQQGGRSPRQCSIPMTILSLVSSSRRKCFRPAPWVRILLAKDASRLRWAASPSWTPLS